MEEKQFKEFILGSLKLLASRVDTLHDFYSNLNSSYSKKAALFMGLDASVYLSESFLQKNFELIIEKLFKEKTTQASLKNILNQILRTNETTLKIDKNIQNFLFERLTDLNISEYEKSYGDSSYEHKACNFIRYIYTFINSDNLEYHIGNLEATNIKKFFEVDKPDFGIDVFPAKVTKHIKTPQGSFIEIPEYEKSNSKILKIKYVQYPITFSVLNLWDSASYTVDKNLITDKEFKTSDYQYQNECSYIAPIGKNYIISTTDKNNNSFHLTINPVIYDYINDKDIIKGYLSIENITSLISDTEDLTYKQIGLLLEIKRTGDGFQRVYSKVTGKILLTEDLCNFVQSKLMNLPVIYDNTCNKTYYYKPPIERIDSMNIDQMKTINNMLPDTVKNILRKNLEYEGKACECCGLNNNFDKGTQTYGKYKFGTIRNCESCLNLFHPCCTHYEYNPVNSAHSIINNFLCKTCKNSRRTVDNISTVCKLCGNLDDKRIDIKKCKNDYCGRHFHISCLTDLKNINKDLSRKDIYKDDSSGFTCPICMNFPFDKYDDSLKAHNLKISKKRTPEKLLESEEIPKKIKIKFTKETSPDISNVSTSSTQRVDLNSSSIESRRPARERGNKKPYWMGIGAGPGTEEMNQFISNKIQEFNKLKELRNKILIDQQFSDNNFTKVNSLFWIFIYDHKWVPVFDFIRNEFNANIDGNNFKKIDGNLTQDDILKIVNKLSELKSEYYEINYENEVYEYTSIKNNENTYFNHYIVNEIINEILYSLDLNDCEYELYQIIKNLNLQFSEYVYYPFNDSTQYEEPFDNYKIMLSDYLYESCKDVNLVWTIYGKFFELFYSNYFELFEEESQQQQVQLPQKEVRKFNENATSILDPDALDDDSDDESEENHQIGGKLKLKDYHKIYYHKYYRLYYKK